MSLKVSISIRAEQDITLQYRWYLENAEMEIAERYLQAVHQTIQRIAAQPYLGVPRHFVDAELARIRSIQVQEPFHRHLLFYWEGDLLRIERIMHGSRDIPRRLLDEE